MDFARPVFTTTSPSAIGALDLNNHFRPPQFLDKPQSVLMEKQENHPSVLSFLLQSPAIKLGQIEMQNPIISTRKDTRLDFETKILKAVATTDTYISLDEPKIASIGTDLYVPEYGATLYVEDKDDDLSEGWKNDATDACNVKVSRTKGGGPNETIAVGTYAIRGPGIVGEEGSPKKGVTTTPGDAIYNLVTVTGRYITMSKMQKNALMAVQGGSQKAWGKWEKVLEDLAFQWRVEKQNALLYSHRKLYQDSTEGNMWRGAGLLDQLQDWTLDVGSLGNQLSFGNLNDFVEGTMESDLSGAVKHLHAGSKLFRAILGQARAENAMHQLDGTPGGNPAYNPAMGTMSFVMSTDSGGLLQVHEEKWSFINDRSDWGVLLDPNTISYGYYKGIQEVFVDDVSSQTQWMVQSPAVFDSFMAFVKEPKANGIIRGGVSGRLNR